MNSVSLSLIGSVTQKNGSAFQGPQDLLLEMGEKIVIVPDLSRKGMPNRFLVLVGVSPTVGVSDDVVPTPDTPSSAMIFSSNKIENNFVLNPEH